MVLLSCNAVLGVSYVIFNSVNFSCQRHNRVGDDVEANQNVEEAEEACEEQNGIENPHARVDFNDFGEMEED